MTNSSTVLPTIRIHFTVSLTGPGRPRGLVSESFTLIDQPLGKGRSGVEPLSGITFVESMSQMCLSFLAVLRQYYLARLTEDKMRAELLNVADALHERCADGRSLSLHGLWPRSGRST